MNIKKVVEIPETPRKDVKAEMIGLIRSVYDILLAFHSRLLASMFVHGIIPNFTAPHQALYIEKVTKNISYFYFIRFSLPKLLWSFRLPFLSSFSP
jgi:hypothetical protein